MSIFYTIGNSRNKLEENILLNALKKIESLGLVFGSLLYDSEDKVFSDVILIRLNEKTKLSHIPRGSPSVTHKMFYGLLQHPKLEFLVKKLKINFANFNRNLQFNEKINKYEYRENGNPNFSHTFSLYFLFHICQEYNLWEIEPSPTSPLSCIGFTERNEFQEFIDKWYSYVNNFEGEEKFIRCFDFLSKVTSSYPYYKEFQPIIEEMILKVMSNFLQLKGFLKNANFYILYLLGEITSMGIQTDNISKIAQDIIPECSRFDIIREHFNSKILIDIEATSAFLCGLVQLSSGIFEKKISSIINFLYQIKDISELYCGMSYKVFADIISFFKRIYEGKEIFYLSSSLPFYFLRLSSFLRKKYNFNESLPFSEDSISRMFLMKKVR